MVGQHGLAGLQDEQRSGKPVTYDESTEKRVLCKLDDPPPEGYGEGLGSNYQRQGLKLSKHLRT